MDTSGSEEEPGPDIDNYILRLKEELREKDEYLQNTIEELETSNEELRSAHEEIHQRGTGDLQRRIASGQ